MIYGSLSFKVYHHVIVLHFRLSDATRKSFRDSKSAEMRRILALYLSRAEEEAEEDVQCQK